MEKVKLYIGSSISDLNKKGKYDFDIGRSIEIHINHSDKTFRAAEEARKKWGDEERGYILYMRYLDIFEKVRGSRDYKANESHYSLLLGTMKVNEAITHAEILSKSLKKRYEALKNSTDAQDIRDKHADEPMPNGVISSVDAKPKRQGSTNLPLNWEKRLDIQTGRYFYLDHKTKTTHWTLPDHVKSKITKTPLRDVPSAPSSGGLKRSSSSPNIAQLKDDTPLTDFQPKPSIPNREQKPKASAEAIRSADDYVQRLGNLHPAPGGSGPGLCGLMNLGNTCYMNSVLQCMFNTTLLVEYFVRGTFKQHINRENFLGSGGEITDGFSLLMKASWSGQFRHLTPRDFRFTISKFNSRFGGYTQQDSQELLLFLMDGLHEDLNEITQRSYKEEEDNCNMNDMVAADVAWQHHARLNKSIIVQLFQGQFKATVQCLHCKKSSRKFDVFMYLSLPLPSQSSCSIYDCIKKFSEVEKLSGDNKWRCPDCKTERDAVRKIEIWKLPPVLFIHFKRFSFCGRWGDKVQTSVKFPEKGLDLNDYVKVQRKKNITYQLYSVSHHYGATLDSGHYVASCKNPIDNKWYKYDDHEVSRTSVPSGPSAYILCYTSLNHSLQINTS